MHCFDEPEYTHTMMLPAEDDTKHFGHLSDGINDRKKALTFASCTRSPCSEWKPYCTCDTASQAFRTQCSFCHMGSAHECTFLAEALHPTQQSPRGARQQADAQRVERKAHQKTQHDEGFHAPEATQS